MDRTNASESGPSPLWIAGQHVLYSDLRLDDWEDVESETDARALIGPSPEHYLLEKLRPAMRLDEQAAADAGDLQTAERMEEVGAELGLTAGTLDMFWLDLFDCLEELETHDISGYFPPEVAELFQHVYLQFSRGRVSFDEIIRNPELWPLGEGVVTRSSDEEQGAELFIRDLDGDFHLLWEAEMPIVTSDKPWLHFKMGGLDWIARFTFDVNGQSNAPKVSESFDKEPLGREGYGHLGRLSDGFPALMEALGRGAVAAGVARPALAISVHHIADAELRSYLPSRCFQILIRDQADWDLLVAAAQRRAEILDDFDWDNNQIGVYGIDLDVVQAKSLLDEPRP